MHVVLVVVAVEQVVDDCAAGQGVGEESEVHSECRSCDGLCVELVGGFVIHLAFHSVVELEERLDGVVSVCIRLVGGQQDGVGAVLALDAGPEPCGHRVGSGEYGIQIGLLTVHHRADDRAAGVQGRVVVLVDVGSDGVNPFNHRQRFQTVWQELRLTVDHVQRSVAAGKVVHISHQLLGVVGIVSFAQHELVRLLVECLHLLVEVAFGEMVVLCDVVVDELLQDGFVRAVEHGVHVVCSVERGPYRVVAVGAERLLQACLLEHLHEVGNLRLGVDVLP